MVTGAIAAVIAVVGAVVTAVMQSKAAKKAADARKRAAAISSADRKNKAAIARRKAVRERRIVAAQISQSSANTGVLSSSGELGASAVLGTNLGANVAAASASNLTADRISAQNQIIADAKDDSAKGAAIGGMISAVGNFAGGIGGATTTTTTGLFSQFNTTNKNTPGSINGMGGV